MKLSQDQEKIFDGVDKQTGHPDWRPQSSLRTKVRGGDTPDHPVTIRLLSRLHGATLRQGHSPDLHTGFFWQSPKKWLSLNIYSNRPPDNRGYFTSQRWDTQKEARKE